MKETTCASNREAQRKLLKANKISPKDVENQSSTSSLSDTSYGSQRRRKGLPVKNNKGQVVYGPRKPNWAPVRKSTRATRTYMSFKGEKLSAKKALERFPRLKRLLIGKITKGNLPWKQS